VHHRSAMQDRMTDGPDSKPGGRAAQRGQLKRSSGGRDATVKRLVRAGISTELATAWIDAWDRSTADLPDFRNASDFWHQGFRYALEEYRRGYRPVVD